MFPIVEAKWIAPGVRWMVIDAPRIAARHQAGHFSIVRVHRDGERIPLTIADSDAEAGTVTLVIQVVGATTEQLCALPEGGELLDIVGPLGKATHIDKVGHVVLVGGGVGTPVIFPQAKAFQAIGNKVTAVIGGRTKPYVLMEEDLRAVCEEVYPCTDDGSYGHHGFVTGRLEELIQDDENPVDMVVTAGPVMMMRAVADVTRERKIETVASLNPIMVDGTGMCGGCRVTVSGEQKFACVDGPEFNAHQVDFLELCDRLTAYREQEKESWGRMRGVYHHDGPCHMEAQADALAAEPSPVLPEDLPAESLEDLKPAVRMKIPRQSMPESDAIERAKSFTEVNLGLSGAVAKVEAHRCLQCKKAGCISGCPVGVDIPNFVGALAEGDIRKAAEILFETNSLPGVTGRVCPQETQCEALCVLSGKHEALAVGYLERFVADWARENMKEAPEPAPATGKRVAIVGAGPAGLTCAGELAKKGHDVTIFEALHRPGGVLIYGIPEFRLPNIIVEQEVAKLQQLGVKIECNVLIGKTFTISDLTNEMNFDTVFIANGAGLPVFTGIPGENLKGVYSANEYLTRANLMQAYKGDETPTPIARASDVVVVGGGNTAMDGVRTSARLGAKTSTLVYRRSREEMPARVEEVEHAEAEGIDLKLLVNPVEVLADDEGWVRAVRCEKMELGAPDSSGRRRPIPIKGSEFDLPCQVFIVAVGTKSNPLLTQTTPELKVNQWGYIEIDEKGMTSIPGVFAGGDIVRGAATVILAMGDGKQAATEIHKFMSH